MRSRNITTLFLAALFAYTMVAERPVQAMHGNILVMAVNGPNEPAVPRGTDPNEPWDPAEHVVATWESLTAMSKLVNPVDGGGRFPERSLSISARVDVIDVNGVIGFDSTAIGTLVLDEKADVVCSEAVPNRYCRFYWPLRYHRKMYEPGQWVSELQPYNLTVEMPLEPDRPYPLLLGRVEWSMYALVSTDIRTVDVPFRPTTDWLTLAPDLEIQVEEITAESTKYAYRIAMRYRRDKARWEANGAAISLWTHKPTPEVIVTKLDVLDPLGRSIQDQASGSFGGGSGGDGGGGTGDLVIGTANGSGNCDICGTATTFRFTLALKVRQQELRFVLENVPVPAL